MREEVAALVDLDGPRKGPKRKDGTREHAPTKRHMLLLRGEKVREPEPPEGCEHLWEAFWSFLNRQRKTNEYSGFPLPLQWAEMRAWADLTGTRLLPWEAEAVMGMDAAYTAAWATLDDGDSSGEGPPPVQDVSAKLKALFMANNKGRRGRHG